MDIVRGKVRIRQQRYRSIAYYNGTRDVMQTVVAKLQSFSHFIWNQAVTVSTRTSESHIEISVVMR